jgi:hypothetical protein
MKVFLIVAAVAVVGAVAGIYLVGPLFQWAAR